MRLEKIMYEKIFNTKVLGRAREITRPSMSYQETNMLLASLPDSFLKNVLWNPLRKLCRRLEWWFLHSVTDQRAVSVEDLTVIKAWEMRRDVLNEHAFRESMHPLARELVRLRGLAHDKVELPVRGFVAPDYLREERRKRTFLEGLGNFLTYRHFFTHNYENEQTTFNKMFTGSRNILEAIYWTNSTERNAFNRFFYNEKHSYTVDDYLDEERVDRKLNLSDPKEFEEFFLRCEAANEKFPGFYAPPGEKLTREALRKTIDQIVEQTGWTDLTSEELTDFGAVSRYHKSAFVVPNYPTEEVKPGTNNVGLDYPAFLRKWQHKALFS